MGGRESGTWIYRGGRDRASIYMCRRQGYLDASGQRQGDFRYTRVGQRVRVLGYIGVDGGTWIYHSGAESGALGYTRGAESQGYLDYDVGQE